MGYALSLFDSLDNARKRYNQIRRYNKNFHKFVGTHIASGHIESADGVSSITDEKGHITLHPSADVDLVHKFEIVEEVYHANKD